MKKLIIIAGPNGAGKTSFARQYLSSGQENLKFVNADEIARTLSPSGLPQEQLDLKAAREMLMLMKDYADEGIEFMLETTLANLTYARKIPIWQKLGYTVGLIYLRLPSVEHSISRVKIRVKSGGHNIPEHIIRRRFEKSLQYLDKIYKPIVDEWYIWDSLEGDFKMAETWDDQ